MSAFAVVHQEKSRINIDIHSLISKAVLDLSSPRRYRINIQKSWQSWHLLPQTVPSSSFASPIPHLNSIHLPSHHRQRPSLPLPILPTPPTHNVPHPLPPPQRPLRPHSAGAQYTNGSALAGMLPRGPAQRRQDDRDVPSGRQGVWGCGEFGD